MLTNEHNLGKLSRVFHTLQEAVLNIDTSYVYSVWINDQGHLSSSFKQMIPVIGNRLSLNDNEEVFYLIIDSQGKLTKKIRL